MYLISFIKSKKMMKREVVKRTISLAKQNLHANELKNVREDFSNPNITTINLSHNRLSYLRNISEKDQGVSSEIYITYLKSKKEYLKAFFMTQCSNMKHINLSHNFFPDEISDCLLKIFKSFPQLESLDLSYTGIGDGAICALTELLTESNSIKKIYMKYNCLTEEAVDKMQNILEQNEKKKNVKFSVYCEEDIDQEWSNIIIEVDDLSKKRRVKLPEDSEKKRKVGLPSGSFINSFENKGKDPLLSEDSSSIMRINSIINSEDSFENNSMKLPNSSSNIEKFYPLSHLYMDSNFPSTIPFNRGQRNNTESKIPSTFLSVLYTNDQVELVSRDHNSKNSYRKS